MACTLAPGSSQLCMQQDSCTRKGRTMLANLEFYVCLVVAVLLVVFFLLLMIRIHFGFSTAKVFLVLVVFAAGCVAGPWFFSFVTLYGPR